MVFADFAGVLSIILSVLVPLATSIFAYRQVMAKIIADKATRDEAEETKRLELLVGVPKESAAAFDTGSRALREVIEFLGKQIAERDERATMEREMFAREVTALRAEITKLTGRVEDQSQGIGQLIAQVEKLNAVPVYRRHKTGPLAGSGG